MSKWSTKNSSSRIRTIRRRATGRQLPQHQSHRIHVYPEERISLEVNGPFQNLRGHVTSGSHLQRTERPPSGQHDS